MLELYIHRIKQSMSIDKTIIATTMKSENDILQDITINLGVDCFRGNENDLLERYYRCAVKYKPDAVARVTADNPFVDYQLIDYSIELFANNRVDFVTNHFEPTYPGGAGCRYLFLSNFKKIMERSAANFGA